MGYSNINIKWFIGTLLFIVLLIVLGLDTLLIYFALAGFGAAVGVALIGAALLLLVALFYIFRDAILWNLWKKISYPIHPEFFKPDSGKKVLEEPREEMLASSTELEGIENAILAAASIYSGFFIGFRNVDIFVAVGKPIFLLIPLVTTIAVGFLFYAIVLRLPWHIVLRPLFFGSYSKLTRKKVVGYTTEEIKQQVKEIRKFYKRTVNVLGDRFSGYRNLGADGLLTSVKDSDVRLLFDYSSFEISEEKRVRLPHQRRPQRQTIISRIPVFRITAYVPNFSGKEGAIGWPNIIPESFQKGKRYVKYSPSLEPEYNKIIPIIERLLREKKLRLEGREIAKGRPLSVLFQKKGVLVLMSLKKDFRDEELKAAYNAIIRIRKALS